MKRQNFGKFIKRKLFRSQLAEINLIKICLALVFSKVPLEILHTKGKLVTIILSVIIFIMTIIAIIMIMKLKIGNNLKSNSSYTSINDCNNKF